MGKGNHKPGVWDKNDLYKAIVEIKIKKLRVADVAKKYGMAGSTLYRQLKRREKAIIALANASSVASTDNKSPLASTTLTAEEEKGLENAIENYAQQSYTFTPSDIKRICYAYCEFFPVRHQFNETSKMASDEWYTGFLQRFPNVQKLIKNEEALQNNNPTVQTTELRQETFP